MTELTIRCWPDPVLVTPTDPIHPSLFGTALEEFGKDLITCMLESAGVGLAGPQVGFLTRIFSMQFIDRVHSDPHPPICVCNPVILEFDPNREYNLEGCLSIPGVEENIPRSTEVFLQYQTPFGERRQMVLRDIEARIVQHEVDHLNGVLFIDHLSPTRRRELLRIMAGRTAVMN